MRNAPNSRPYLGLSVLSLKEKARRLKRAMADRPANYMPPGARAPAVRKRIRDDAELIRGASMSMIVNSSHGC